jgi:hypothetical protein
LRSLSSPSFAINALFHPGYLERYYIAQHHVNFHTKVQLTALYKVPKLLILSEDSNGFERLLYAALAETISHHPIMSAVLEGYGTSKPKWRRLDKINLRKLVTVVDKDTPPMEWIQKEHCLSFDHVDELPLWRIVAALSPESTEQEQHVHFNLGGFFFHGIADGISTAAFHLTFLDALNKVAEGEISLSTEPLGVAAIVQAPPDQPLLPNLEMSGSLRLELKFILKTIFKDLIHPTADPQHWSGPVISDSPDPAIPNFRLSSIPWPVVDELVTRCRREQTTITALIVTLLTARIAALHPEYLHFSCSVPYSLRKLTGHGPRDMGCYVSSTRVAFSTSASNDSGFISCAVGDTDEEENAVDNSRVWASARECTRHIRNAVDKRSNHTVSLLKYIADLRKYFLDMRGRERKYSCEATNIGVINGWIAEDGLPVGQASFDRAIFTGNVSRFSGPFCLSICTVKNGLMTIVLGWEQGVVNDETAEGLSAWLETRLMSLAAKSTAM